jgi:hypothetical protein
MAVLQFFRAVGKHWWALMSCALFTVLGLYILSQNKSNAWAVNATFALAAFCLLGACFLAWRDENNQAAQAKKELSDLLKKHFSERPLLGVEAHSVEGPKTWRETAVPVTFSIHLLSGRVPTSICFASVPSLRGKFSLRFDAIPHAEKHPKGMAYRVHEEGVPLMNAHDAEKLRYVDKEMFLLFLDDSPPELLQLEYILVANFKDGDEELSQKFKLTFDKTTYRFLQNTAMPQ